ncbi:ankyrin repeat-containing domain protein [Xylariaceae sp. FL1019]|nr:ankyrin repeat-containing domain protein [Xylariaceae sp. FL1019]
MPKTLNEIYERLLCAIDELFMDDVRTALQWLVSSERPLTLAEFAEACSIHVRNETDIHVEEISEDILHGLLNVLGPLILVEETQASSYHKQDWDLPSYANLRDCFGPYAPLLHYASQSGNVELVEFLIEKGADLTAGTDYGNTPLHEAIRHRAVDVVKLLIQRGADVSVVDRSGLTPIHLVIEYGLTRCCSRAVAVIRLLFEVLLDASHTFPEDDYSRSPLLYSILTGEYEFFELLVQHQAPQACDRFGSSPLSTAVRGGREDMVRLLLTLPDVDITSDDCCGRTPLWWARKQLYAHIEKLLLEHSHEHGADISIFEPSCQENTADVEYATVGRLMTVGGSFVQRFQLGGRCIHGGDNDDDYELVPSVKVEAVVD